MKKLTTDKLCILALCSVINLIGSQAALLLHLPIYLDSMGTVFASAVMGPYYGMIPGIASNLLSGCTMDIYAFYYIPVQMITGCMAGVVFRKIPPRSGKDFGRILFGAGLISIPGTLVSSLITASVFGGITSSGSTIFVQLLHKLGMGLPASICMVQGVTDFADRTVVLVLAVTLLSAFSVSLKMTVNKGREHGEI